VQLTLFDPIISHFGIICRGVLRFNISNDNYQTWKVLRNQSNPNSRERCDGLDQPVTGTLRESSIAARRLVILVRDRLVCLSSAKSRASTIVWSPEISSINKELMLSNRKLSKGKVDANRRHIDASFRNKKREKGRTSRWIWFLIRSLMRTRSRSPASTTSLWGTSSASGRSCFVTAFVYSKLAYSLRSFLFFLTLPSKNLTSSLIILCVWGCTTLQNFFRQIVAMIRTANLHPRAGECDGKQVPIFIQSVHRRLTIRWISVQWPTAKSFVTTSCASRIVLSILRIQTIVV